MTQSDRTLRAVRKQLAAMSASEYEVGVLDADEKMQIRTWSPGQTVKSVGWLKYQNMQRSHIYIRPKGNQGLILIDDATQAVIDRLKGDGVIPACVVETSPLNFQAWVRMSKTDLDNEKATQVAQYLAYRYDCDAAAAAWRQFGRLAGFTNTKPHHVGKDGKFPFVLLHDATGTLAPDAARIFEEAHEWEKRRAAQRHLVMSNEPPQGEAADMFKRELASLVARYGDNLNESQADWMIASKLAQQGFPREDIAAAMVAYSPDIQERKFGRVEKYVETTLNKVFQRFH